MAQRVYVSRTQNGTLGFFTNGRLVIGFQEDEIKMNEHELRRLARGMGFDVDEREFLPEWWEGKGLNR